MTETTPERPPTPRWVVVAYVIVKALAALGTWAGITMAWWK